MSRGRVVEAARRLRDRVSRLSFSPPVARVYNPLAYAWEPHEIYLRRFADSARKVVFLGMNPGPFGMVQTGVPFGEVSATRDWLRIPVSLGRLPEQHPQRPILGLDCPRSEVSGRRLWGLFARRFETPDRFFARHLVMNYCPLAFLDAGGANRTPDKLPASEREPLFAACDEHLRAVVEALEPEWLIGVGDFALKQARRIFLSGAPRLERILHPSPASPAANRDWAGAATRQLEDLGVWERQ